MNDFGRCIEYDPDSDSDCQVIGCRNLMPQAVQLHDAEGNPGLIAILCPHHADEYRRGAWLFPVSKAAPTPEAEPVASDKPKRGKK